MSRSRDRRQRAEARAAAAAAAAAPQAVEVEQPYMLLLENTHGIRFENFYMEGTPVGVRVIGGHDNFLVNGTIDGARTAFQLWDTPSVGIINTNHIA